MPRRVGLPGASELFRNTTPDAAPKPKPTDKPPRKASAPAASGRVKHDEKITVYVNSEELLALEHLRLELRAQHGIAVDRGRIVRAAIAGAVADVAARGTDSDLLKRLADQ